KRDPVSENDLSDALATWRNKDPKKDTDRLAKHFMVPVTEIEAKDFDLSMNRYSQAKHETVQHEPPKKIIAALRALESDIATALLGIDATTNQAVCHIRPTSSEADTRYLWYALKSKLPELLAKRVGGAQPNISQETIRATRVRLPRLDEQRRIAAVLDRADAI